MLDTPEQIKGYIPQIQARVVTTHNMPLANKTEMTEPERELIGRWIAQGAPIDGTVPSTPRPRPPPPASAPPAPKPSEAPAPASGPEQEARAYFQKKCVICHGSSGAGDGPAASALTPKPKKFSDASWQASVSDEALKKVIVGGGAAVGKSGVMPANPDLEDKPELVTELVRVVRGFGG
jgi:cytochrome c551/c552